MASLNMVKVNTLFKKGYLLAGVVMAANMFVANEVKASAGSSSNLNQQENQQNPQEQNPLEVPTNNTTKKITFQELPTNTYDLSQNENNTNDLSIIEGREGHKKKQSPLDILLSCENYFNFFGTLALSGANNYFKLWDYNPGSYCHLRIGCLGYRTKKFFDIVQLDFNLNLWRGIGWSIPHIIKFRRSLTKAQIQDNTEIKQNEEENVGKGGSNASPWVSFLFKDILQGFVSMPLTFHISNFSIAISFDSILWEFVIGRFLKDKDEQGEGEKNQYTSPLETVPITNEIN